MIVLPRGFGVVHELDSLRLIHPDGPDVASIEYRERVRPLFNAGAAIRRYLAEHAEFACGPLPDVVERTTTAEGEYAAIATLAGSEGGAPVQRDLGLVFGDDFYAQIASTCYRAEHFDEMTQHVRELVLNDTHLLGIRRRRFEYAPPRGWQPIVRGFVTDWLAPEFPRDAVHLTVYPANPIVVAPAKLLASMLGTGRTDVDIERERIVQIRTSGGLAGEAGEALLVAGPRRVAKFCAVMHDVRYVYAFEGTAQDERMLENHRSELEDVFASAQPVPSSQDRQHDHDFAAQSYWIE